MQVVTVHEQCEKWLTQRLSGGDLPAKIVKQQASAVGFSSSTLWRTCTKLGVTSKKDTSLSPPVVTWSL